LVQGIAYGYSGKSKHRNISRGEAGLLGSSNLDYISPQGSGKSSLAMAHRPLLAWIGIPGNMLKLDEMQKKVLSHYLKKI
jgi:hypothetical protein